MDCSETYIKMSVQAWPDLQPLINEDMIDWRHQGYCTQHNCLAREGYDGCAECPKWQEEYDALSLDFAAQDALLEVDKNCQPPLGTKWIPLLHQDQLQAMVGIRTCLDYAQFKADKKGVELERWILPLSLEAMWLLVVMKEKFAKTWNKGQWHKFAVEG